MSKETSYSREEASNILGISTRTLDRYIKSKKIKGSQIAGRVRVYQTELEKFAEILGKKIITQENIIEPDQKKKTPVKLGGSESKEIALPQGHIEGLYRDLYEETKSELRTVYQELTMANYKLGQLEEKLSTSVPLLEDAKRKEEMEKKTENIQKELKMEKFNKWIFAILLLVIAALQPIFWLISK